MRHDDEQVDTGAVLRAWATAIALTEHTAHRLDDTMSEIQDYLDDRKMFGERRNSAPYFGGPRGD